MTYPSLPEEVPILHTRFRIITPMFIHGIYPQKAELRLPSVKGCLRFWFRAIHPGYFVQTDQRRKAPTLEEMIFGSAQHGQSRFLMHLPKHSLRHVPYFEPRRGTCSFFVVKGVSKHYFLPGQSFSLSFAFRPEENQLRMKQVYQAVIASTWLLGNIGGLGSHTRRSYGSLLLEEWQSDDHSISKWTSSLPMLHSVSTLEEWKTQFHNGIKTIRSWFPPPKQAVPHVKDFPNTRLDQEARLYFQANLFDSEEAARKAGERVLHAFANSRSDDQSHRFVLGLLMYFRGRQVNATAPKDFKSAHAKNLFEA
ncbi:type III-B CRISPR module RAMP protein Cmr1 [Thermoflavimicrobium daqui]|uniref:Type III-B CRISPR module RAMP protein Cmr1 n=1 Tax=Thermoflavimicrobium daqui TaxID=2137476 RepID=A0A364K2S5_9BACL|nr:type III-B CRISPR module RAMP protein Cmr1 [Thermoflavimicrobium daqui]RAL22724.1 type III-B CRISPR module RAMP protein Cmr1 [Thermoflavimicrobium daqui]